MVPIFNQLEVKAGKWRRSVKGGADLPADVAMSIFDYDEEEVARQLTICEFLLYREIKSSELLNQAHHHPFICCVHPCELSQ